MKHSRFETSYPGSTSVDGDMIIEERFSRHRSNVSSSANTVKYTKSLSGGRSLRVYNINEAIKKTNNFIGIFVRSVANLAEDRYDTKPTSKLINLGEYDPTHFSAIFFVLGSSKERFEKRVGFA